MYHFRIIVKAILVLAHLFSLGKIRSLMYFFVSPSSPFFLSLLEAHFIWFWIWVWNYSLCALMQRHWEDVCHGLMNWILLTVAEKMGEGHSFWLSPWLHQLEVVIVKADIHIPAGLDPVNHAKEPHHSSLSSPTLTEKTVLHPEGEYLGKAMLFPHNLLRLDSCLL